MTLKAGINRARQLANLKGAKDYEFYKQVVNWLEELQEYKTHRNNIKAFKGMSDTRLYRIWNGMIQRCYKATSDGYKYYGGRGIKICDEWTGEDGFWNFYNWAIRNGYADDLSIDRIDVNGNYCPENCRWATAYVQAHNKRAKDILLTYNNTTKTIKEWANHLGINHATLYNRFRKGWTVERILETPLDNSKSHKNAGRKYTYKF